MKQRNKELDRIKRRRREMVDHLYRMLEELEGRPVRRLPASRFPFEVLEKAIGAALDSLERLARWTTDAVFNWLEKRRRR